MSARKKRSRGFRPSSVTQSPAIRVPDFSAREWFAILRPRLLDSRPLLKPARVAEYRKAKFVAVRDKKTGEVVLNEDGSLKMRNLKFTQRVTKQAVYGRPTFHNAIIEGEHV